MAPSRRLHKSVRVVVNHEFEVMRRATQHPSKDQLVGRPPFKLALVYVAAMAVRCTLCKVCAASIEAARTLFMLSTMQATLRQADELGVVCVKQQHVAQHTKTPIYVSGARAAYHSKVDVVQATTDDAWIGAI